MIPKTTGDIKRWNYVDRLASIDPNADRIGSPSEDMRENKTLGKVNSGLRDVPNAARANTEPAINMC